MKWCTDDWWWSAKLINWSTDALMMNLWTDDELMNWKLMMNWWNDELMNWWTDELMNWWTNELINLRTDKLITWGTEIGDSCETDDSRESGNSCEYIDFDHSSEAGDSDDSNEID